MLEKEVCHWWDSNVQILTELKYYMRTFSNTLYLLLLSQSLFADRQVHSPLEYLKSNNANEKTMKTKTVLKVSNKYSWDTCERLNSSCSAIQLIIFTTSWSECRISFIFYYCLQSNKWNDDDKETERQRNYAFSFLAFITAYDGQWVGIKELYSRKEFWNNWRNSLKPFEIINNYYSSGLKIILIIYLKCVYEGWIFIWNVSVKKAHYAMVNLLEIESIPLLKSSKWRNIFTLMSCRGWWFLCWNDDVVVERCFYYVTL